MGNSRKLGKVGTRAQYMKQVVLKRKRSSSLGSLDAPTKLTPQNIQVKQFFSDDPFDSLPIRPELKQNISTMGLSKMTNVQAMAVPPALRGHDILASAKTGSGKTLAFLIPAIELLNKSRFRREQGTGVLIITPTRELALQILNVAKELMENMTHSYGMVIGGTNLKTEAHKLQKHVNLLVGTPGRLLDHLLNAPNFVYNNLLMLIIDEADAMLKQGFEEEMNQILRILPTERQTLLFSATQTKKVEDLSRVSLKSPVMIGIEDAPDAVATVETLQQGYVVIEPDNKFLLLYTFLKLHVDYKIMVFLSSCDSVKYHSTLFNFVDLKVLDIHGKQKQQKRTSTFLEFCKMEKGILLCTDVAARGLDIPQVDWIIQYDPPDQPEEYIHRVGRTARVQKVGKALLFLLPQELGFLRFLKQSRVPLSEFEFSSNKLANIQPQLERLVEKNYFLHKAARDGYRSYLLAYASHHRKDIFNVANLDLQKVGKAFGFTTPPRVNLNLKISGRGAKTQPANYYRKNQGHMFSNANPQGKRPEGDQRQFAF